MLQSNSIRYLPTVVPNEFGFELVDNNTLLALA